VVLIEIKELTPIFCDLKLRTQSCVFAIYMEQNYASKTVDISNLSKVFDAIKML